MNVAAISVLAGEQKIFLLSKHVGAESNVGSLDVALQLSIEASRAYLSRPLLSHAAGLMVKPHTAHIHRA